MKGLVNSKTGGASRMNLSGKTAVITGASKGIGRSTALAMAECGINVIINYKSDDQAAVEILALIKAAGGNAKAIKGDISDYRFARQLITAAVESFGKVDILVNNAGISKSGLFTDMHESDWDDIIDTNLKGVFNCTHHAVKQMLPHKSGSIINISSVWGNTGGACEVFYSASKGGINAFTKALGKELAPAGIRVNAIAPGIIDTQMNQHFSTAVLKNMQSEIPGQRFGQGADVAKLAIFLASEQADYITAQVITIDGGWT